MKDHLVQFPRWMSHIHRGYSIVCYGLGSKKSLLHKFHEKYLEDEDTVVVNGFFPSLTLKQILSTISEDIMEIEGNFSSTAYHIEEILANLSSHLYLIIHNIDGPMLRNTKTQSAMWSLAPQPAEKNINKIRISFIHNISLQRFINLSYSSTASSVHGIFQK